MSSERRELPVTVVIPTIGRVDTLEKCLASLASCDPAAAEILIVDQSHAPEVEELSASFGDHHVRVVPCFGRGVSKGRNDGLKAAAHEIVLVTDDDCTVQTDWIGAAWQAMDGDAERIVTGRVVHVGDPRGSTDEVDDDTPREFTGAPRTGVLFPNNMALGRTAVLSEEGGFDERFGPEEAAEDNEFCYRWLKAGRRLLYEPKLVAFHHHWREPAELERLHVRYARGEGFLYAKNLRGGDLRMLRFIARDLVWALRGLLAAVVKRRERWTDFRRGILAGMPRGFRDGWRAFGQRE
jgi:GT2 family glycosyltransferase